MQQSQQSKADTAPVIPTRPKEEVPVRSSTVGNLQSLQHVNYTAKLRVEKFKVWPDGAQAFGRKGKHPCPNLNSKRLPHEISVSGCSFFPQRDTQAHLIAAAAASKYGPHLQSILGLESLFPSLYMHANCDKCAAS